MASLCLVATLGFGRFSNNLILPSMKDGLGLNYTQLGLLGTANMIGYLIAVPVAGVLASRFGSRLVMGLAMLVTGIALLSTGFSPTFELAFISQVVAGIGSAAAIVPSMALASIWVAPSKRGLATGIVNAGLGISFFVTGPLIPALIASSTDMGWRYAWYLLAAVVLGSGLIVAAFMRNRPQDMGLPPLGAAAAAPIPGSATSSLDWGAVYRSRPVWHLAFLYFIFGFAYSSYLTFFAAFLRDQGGLAGGIIGNMWAISGLGIVVGCLAWGSLSDMLGRKTSIIIVFFFLALAILLFTVSQSVWIFTLSAFIFWMAEPGVPVIVAAASGDYVGGRLVPAAIGFVTLFMGIGQAGGPLLTGRIADMTASFDMAFYIAAAAALLGMLSTVFLKQPKMRL